MPNESPPDRPVDHSSLALSSVGWTNLALVLVVLLVATVGSVAADSSDVSLGENVVQTGRDGVTTIDVTLENRSTTGFWIESERRTRIDAELVDVNSDGEVTVRIDTGDSTQNGDPLEATGDDSIRDVTVRNTTRNGEFYQGQYELIAGPAKNSSASDFGSLTVLTGPTAVTKSTATPEPTPEPTPRHRNGTVVVHEGEYVSVPNESDAQIHGETHLPAGTELSVTIRSTGATTPGFYENLEATVSEDGTFSVILDVSENHPGDRFEITVEHNGTTLTTAGGRVGACRDCETPSPTPTWSQSDPPGFINETNHVVRSRMAKIPVRINVTNATLVIGREVSMGYEQRVHLHDSNGDGVVVVGFSTWAAGTNYTTVEDRTGEDQIVSGYETDLDDQLAAGPYDLLLYAGNDTDGEPVDWGTLLVHEAPRWSELTETETPSPSPVPRSTPSTVGTTTGDQPVGETLYGVGGLTVGGGLGAVGILLLLRGKDGI